MNTEVDLTDLLRGEGEWRNMQEIVRKTFKACFDKMHYQDEQITKLIGKVRSLKEELANRPDTEDIIKLIASKTPKPSKSFDDVERLKAALTSLRTDVERKASLSYVDDSLKRKIDKSDILVHNLSKITSSQYLSDINQLQHDVVEMRSHLDLVNERSNQSYKELKAAYVGDVSTFRVQLNELDAKANQWVTKTDLTAALDNKPNKVEVDSLLSRKADQSSLQAATSRFESSLGEHEKLITALRLKVNEEVLRGGDPLLRGHPLTQPSFHRGSSGSNIGGGGGIMGDELQREEGDLGCLLKSGRIEAIVQGLWTKMNTVTMDSQRSTQDVINMKASLLTVENSLKSCAGQHHLETLAAAFEEQRLRLDSVILGSTDIAPVSKQLKQCSSDVSEIKAYLRLPQKKPLRDQLHEAGELIDVLSHSVSDLRSMVSRSATRLDVVEASSHQLDSRVRLLESSTSHKLEVLGRHTELGEGAAHQTVREVSDDVRGLWERVREVAHEARGETGRAAKELADRLEAMENDLVVFDMKHNKAEEELREGQKSYSERLSVVDQQQATCDRKMDQVVDKVKELRSSVRTASRQKSHSSGTATATAVGVQPRGTPVESRRTPTAAPHPPPAAPLCLFSDTESFDSSSASHFYDQPSASALGLSTLNISASDRPSAPPPAPPVVTSSSSNKENIRQPPLTSEASTSTSAGGSADLTKRPAPVPSTSTTSTSPALREQRSSSSNTFNNNNNNRRSVVSVAVGAGGGEGTGGVQRTGVTSESSSSSSSSSSSPLDENTNNITMDGISLPAALSLLQSSKFVALTSVEKIDERLETLKAEREALKRRLLSGAEI